MDIEHVKFAAATIAGGAIIAAAAVVTAGGSGNGYQTVASGSGDSATGTNYVQPSIPAMTFGATATQTTPSVADVAATTLADSDASPTYKAAPPSGYAP